jgi:hypothetical protein
LWFNGFAHVAQRDETHAARVYNGSPRFAVDGWRDTFACMERYDQVLAG